MLHPQYPPEYFGWLCYSTPQHPEQTQRLLFRLLLVLLENLLRLLTDTHPAEIAIQPYPHELEVATITFFGKYDKRPIDTVRIAKDPDSGLWILENGDDVLRFFKESMVHINLTPLDFGLVSAIPD